MESVTLVNVKLPWLYIAPPRPLAELLVSVESAISIFPSFLINPPSEAVQLYRVILDNVNVPPLNIAPPTPVAVASYIVHREISINPLL